MTTGCFITASGTDAGKTRVALAITAALRASGQTVTALKPVETGCSPDPQDAQALARACARPELAHHLGFYRAADALAPAAAARLRGPKPPPLSDLASACLSLHETGTFLLVEGAGGLLVPYDEQATMADLALALSLPVLLVAPDTLGALSHSLCAYEAAERRGLRVAGLVLNQGAGPASECPKEGPASNRALLAERIPVPVVVFPRCGSAPDDLAHAARESGLLGLVTDD